MARIRHKVAEVDISKWKGCDARHYNVIRCEVLARCDERATAQRIADALNREAE
jgi:hypothetical protein